jgi:hypothetical protein
MMVREIGIRLYIPFAMADERTERQRCIYVKWLSTQDERRPHGTRTNRKKQLET